MSDSDCPSGKQPWNSKWLAICSRHPGHCRDCELCIIGQWRNRTGLAFSSLVFRCCPRLWRWWANSRWDRKNKEWLESVFPGLRGKKGE